MLKTLSGALLVAMLVRGSVLCASTVVNGEGSDRIAEEGMNK